MMSQLSESELPSKARPLAGVEAPPPPVRRLVSHAPAMSWRRLRSRLGRQEWLPSVLWLLFDALAWTTIYSAAAFLRVDVAYDEHLPLLRIEALSLAVIVTTFFVVGGYDRRTAMCSLGYMSEHLIALTVAAGLTSLLIYAFAAFDHSMRPSRGVLLVSFLAFGPVSLAHRRRIGWWLEADTARKTFLILGAGAGAQRLFRAYQGSPNRQRLRFIAPDDQGVGQLLDGEGSPVVEGDLQAQLRASGPECSGVILAEDPQRLSRELLDQLVRLHFQQVPVYTLEGFYETHWRRVPVHAINPAWALQGGFQLVRDSPYAHLKRLFDILFAAGGLLLVSPVLLLLGVLVWADSGRPVLFRQVRVGRDYHLFDILKFRTMRHVPADAGVEPKEGDLYTTRGDVRITRVGGWLRKLRLDEFPQLWNVLRGDMSLIGPRAEWVKLAERYEVAIPGYNLRHLVKPGITGWAQVNYPYGASQEDAIQKLKYDLYYIRHYSLKLDAMIVLKTLHVMLFGKGQ